MNPSDGNSEFNRAAFLVQTMQAMLRTSALVKVMAVTANGDVAPAVFVDVQPLVRMVDGQGNTSDHGTIHNLPYFRIQGGTNGVICDPQVGDIGLAVFCDRDSSSAKANRAVASPGSWRQHDMADGFYLGGWPSAAPTQYIQFSPTGINQADSNGNKVEMVADGIKINGVLFTRDRKISTFVEATADGGHTLTAHVHSDPQGGTVGPPTG